MILSTAPSGLRCGIFGVAVLLLGFLLSFIYPIKVTAAVVINEVMYDPIGSDTGLEWIELYNNGCIAEDLTGYELTGASGNFFVFPSIALPAWSWVTVHWRADGTNIANEIYTGSTLISTNLGNSSGYVAIFDGSTHSKSTIVDYVEYGSAAQSWETAAVDAGLWTAGDYVVGVSSGDTLGLIVDGQDLNQSVDWQGFSPSSLSGANSIGVTPALCPTITATPTPTVTPGFTPAPTLTPTVLPTPTLPAAVITIELPTMVTAGQPFNIALLASHLVANTEYSVKFEASIDGQTWYSGKTIAADGGSYLSWNASWTNYPVAKSTVTGEATVQTKAMIRADAVAGTYQGRIKMYQISSSQTVWSAVGTVSTVVLTVTPVPTLAPSMTPTPTPVADGSVDHPPDSLVLSLIADAREAAIGEWVKIEGVVTAEPEQLGSRVMYVEDESAGIKILLDRKDRDDIHYKDYVEITGIVGESYGEAYIKVVQPTDVRWIKVGDLPETQMVRTADVGEDLEGSLITVNGQVVATSGNTFYLDDGSGEAKIYIKDSTGIDKPSMRVGYYSLVTGIVSQYKDDYRLLPRFMGDLLVSKMPIDAGSVLSARANWPNQLPQTGFSIHDGGLILLFVGLILREIVLAGEKSILQ